MTWLLWTRLHGAGVQTPVGDPDSVILDQHPEAELLGRLVVTGFTFAGTSTLFPVVTAPICLPTRRPEAPHLQRSSPLFSPLLPALPRCFLSHSLPEQERFTHLLSSVKFLHNWALNSLIFNVIKFT